ncbi:hypothetical protein E2C01_096826 [Portunus trituberculatus]|uniref:Uncharacterized protein n=1 Tax=Portunus trituberculatus TaxID=210409 RepID=A0A5B7K320_PORTR|nr:hypothetical protein [Portunus trituberculatus]
MWGEVSRLSVAPVLR